MYLENSPPVETLHGPLSEKLYVSETGKKFVHL